MIFTSDPNLQIVRNGLQLWYDVLFQTSYPGSGTTLDDLSGNNTDGILFNGVAYSSTNGGYLIFDGTNDYVDTTNVFDGYTDFSISLWIKTSSTARGNVFGCYSGGTGNTNAVAIEVNRGATIPDVGSVFIFARKGSGSTDNIIAYISGLSINDNSWHNIVWCVDASTATNTFYMDGVSQTVTIITNNFSANAFGTFQFTNWIGGLNNEGALAVPYSGNVASTYVYNRVLTSAEVAHNYKVTKGRFT